MKSRGFVVVLFRHSFLYLLILFVEFISEIITPVILLPINDIVILSLVQQVRRARRLAVVLRMHVLHLFPRAVKFLLQLAVADCVVFAPIHLGHLLALRTRLAIVPTNRWKREQSAIALTTHQFPPRWFEMYSILMVPELHGRLLVYPRGNGHPVDFWIALADEPSL